jgi:pre-mRNA-processing factor 19
MGSTRVDSVKWDYTGQFLAAADPSGVSVQQYSKATKTWSEPLRVAVPAVAAAWGPSANMLATVNDQGIITVLGPST